MNLLAGVRVFERGWLSSNNILLQQAGGASLIDSGYGTHAAQTIALLEQGLGNAPLTQIVNTHCHSDHVGGNAAIRRRFGCRIVIPEGEAPLVERWDEDALLYRYADQFCERFEFDATCAPGDVLRLGSIDWQVLAAPGHDAHAVMLHAPAERLLISGRSEERRVGKECA